MKVKNLNEFLELKHLVADFLVYSRIVQEFVIPLANDFNYYIAKERRQMARNQKTWQKAVAWGTTIATSIAGLVGGGFFLGQYLDAHWGTRPWLTISLMMLGLILGAIYLVITLKEFGASDDKK